MSVAIISAIAGLAGAAVGGVTSTLGAALSERIKCRRQTAEVVFNRHSRIYTDFIHEAAKHFADAIARTSVDPRELVTLYALIARMRLGSPRSVVAAAETVMVRLEHAYSGPIRSLSEIAIFEQGGDSDPLLEFSLACRDELESRKASLLG